MQKTKKIPGFLIYFDKKLGEGSFGKVYVGEEDGSHQKVAVKIMDRQTIDKDQYLRNATFQQINILKSLKSVNIVQFKGIVQSAHHYYLVQELCEGGDLRKLINNKGPLSESNAVKCLSQIANGFIELIKEGVIHRDLKPENIFIHNGEYKIADFGFSKRIHHRRIKNQSMVGTPLYMPIEILKNIPYTSKCDIFSLGIIFYELLFKKLPWLARTQYEIIRCIEKQPLNVSAVARDFINKCLKPYEKERMSWDQLLKHQIFAGKFNFYFQKTANLQNRFKQAINKLKFYLTKMNTTLEKAWLANGYSLNQQINFEIFDIFINKSTEANLTPEQIRYIFDKVDSNANDSISLDELKKQLSYFGIGTTPNKTPEKNQARTIDSKIKEAFELLLKSLYKHNITVDAHFQKFNNEISFVNMFDFLNSIGSFSQQQTQEVCSQIGHKNWNVSKSALEIYFKRITGLTKVQITKSNQPVQKKLNGDNFSFQVQNRLIEPPSHNHNPPLINQNEEGPVVVYNERLGIYTELFDSKYHSFRKKFLGIF